MQLGFDAFCTLLEDLPEPDQTIAVAVSGGADSLALSLCLMQWCEKTDRQLIGISIDHGIRKEAALECDFVKGIFEKKGFEHHTLKWSGEKITQSIQNAARKARYSLITEFCLSRNIRDVFLGHHLDDQAETVILRLMRGSGVDGLSAIHKVQNQNGLRLFRPFLSVPKSDLETYLKANQQDWINDPSNDNDAFDRVKVRKALKVLNEIGLSADRLALCADNMQRTRTYLQSQQEKWFSEEVEMFDEGYAHIKREAVLNGDEEIVFRSLRQIGQRVGGQSDHPRLLRLKNLYENIAQGKSTTFMGCRWIVEKKTILVCRELRNNLEPIPFSKIWDNRFEIDFNANADDLSSRALGHDGWEEVLRIQPSIKSTKLPFPVILSLFSLWQGETLLGVPHLQYWTSQGLDLGLDNINVRFIPEVRLFS